MTQDLHSSLLRPSILQILRATNFTHARPAVVDTFTDLAARYLLLLASSSAANAFNTHNSFTLTVQDVRIAMSENGALWPQMSTSEEALKEPVELAPGSGEWVPFEDLRGVRGFVEWCQGSVNCEIRRVAGLSQEAGGEVNVEQIASGTDEKVDWLSALQKANISTSTPSESRFHDTILGTITRELQPVSIVGGPANSLAEWSTQYLNSHKGRNVTGDTEGASPLSSVLSDAPESSADIAGEEERRTPQLGGAETAAG
ncbi:hypothetical protein DV736_g3754, partial [Chaetothyriales sp. CBS 134916]